MAIKKINLGSVRTSSRQRLDSVMAKPANFTSRWDKKTRRRYIRWGIISGNLTLLLIIGLFIGINRSASQTIRSSTLNGAAATAKSVSNPLDQLSSEQIAYQAAQMTDIPELTMARNRADSAAIVLALAPNDSTVLAKPQVVSTAQKSRHDIINYTSVANDTITALSQKYGVSANSIKLSNNLNADIIPAGTHLLIPPGEGIVYIVKAGDTVDSLVTKYQANKDTFITVNDAEGGLMNGEVIWIPNAVQPVLPARAALSLATSFINVPSSGVHKYNSCSLGINNGYDCGWCTWWAAYRRAQIGRPVPPNMGDAYSWKAFYLASGLPVSNTPQAGAVIWFNYDHVGFVESVNPDGSANISEMNQEGWDRVSYRTIPPGAGGIAYLY